MSILKPVLVLAILSSALLCNNAWATEPPPRVGAVKQEAKPDPAPAKKPAKRRAVRQIIDGMPAPAAPPAPYVPQPVPQPAPHPVPQPAPAAVLQPMPIPTPQTENGGYKGGVGTTLLSPQGRLCSNNGIMVQCF